MPAVNIVTMAENMWSIFSRLSSAIIVVSMEAIIINDPNVWVEGKRTGREKALKTVVNT